MKSKAFTLLNNFAKGKIAAKRHLTGFTLVELLVVISIIGVISSIVFVSFSGSRDKAKLAKAQNFDAQVSHALGAYAVGIWRFESISGGKVSDESGYGNDGTIHGATLASNQGVYSGTSALNFDATDYVIIDNSSIFPDDINKLTLEVWVKPSSEQVSTTRLGTFLIRHSVYPWFLRVYSDNRFEFDIYDTAERNIFSTTKIKSDQWYHVVGVYNGNKSVLYINGKQEAEQNFGINIRSSTSPIYIGKWPGQEFHGLIDDVRIYNEALSVSQIQQHYATGPHTNTLVWGRAPLPTELQ